MTVATYRWTIDQYHQAVNAGVFDDQPVELLTHDRMAHLGLKSQANSSNPLKRVKPLNDRYCGHSIVNFALFQPADRGFSY
jgi:hypothetical protein